MSLREPGLYLLGDQVVDTRTFTSHLLTTPEGVQRRRERPPLALSPDQQSVAWVGTTTEDDGRETYVVGVSDLPAGVAYSLPIARAHMRYAAAHDIDTSWLAHYFEWSTPPDGAGREQLTPRANVTPRPHKGALTLGRPGDFQMYLIGPGGEPLRTRVMQVLVSELGGTRLADDPGGYTQSVELDGERYGVVITEYAGGVTISTYKGDPVKFAQMARRLDEVLATGRLDDVFTSALP